MVGNAVPCNLAYCLATSIKQQLQQPHKLKAQKIQQLELIPLGNY